MTHKISEAREVGFVTRAKRYVFFVEGLPSARINDVIFDEEGNRALVQSLSDSFLTAIALDPVNVRSGARFALPKDGYTLSLGDHLFGRVVNALGEPVDGGRSFPPGDTPLVLDVEAPNIASRTPVKDQLFTGSTLVDTLLPVARGQRQLIFGADRAGKTSFLTDVVRSQTSPDQVSIYVLIGKSVSELNRVMRSLFSGVSSSNAIIVAALSDQLPSRIAIAPSVAFSIAEHFQSRGKHVLIILDDLDAHAKYLREIALLEERLPGRESYPGDLFYRQARLMERSGTFVESVGGGSITTFPVVAAEIEDFSGIIPTNLMSCTDGHLLFLPELQAEGIYPAITQERSVTRVGRQAQTMTQKQLSTRVRLLLSQSRRQRDYAEFGSHLKEEVRAAVHQGYLLEHALRQSPGEIIPSEVQVPLVALALTPFLQKRDLAFFISNKQAISDALRSNPELEDLRSTVREGALPLDAFLTFLTTKQPVFENVCRA